LKRGRRARLGARFAIRAAAFAGIGGDRFGGSQQNIAVIPRQACFLRWIDPARLRITDRAARG
jgi:hypothetical protein